MADTRSPKAILVLTYTLLLITAGWVAARFLAWPHEGWAGFNYVPAIPEGFKGKTWFFKPGSVSGIFSGGPAEAGGRVAGDVVLAVNGIPTSNWEQLAKLDDQLRIQDEISHQVQLKDGHQKVVQVRLTSPLRSRQIQASTISSMAVALAFCFLGTLVYRRKPEDERALIFYLLSITATILFVVSPLDYVDVFPSRGARSLAQMTGHQVILYLVFTTLGYLLQVLVVRDERSKLFGMTGVIPSLAVCTRIPHPLFRGALTFASNS